MKTVIRPATPADLPVLLEFEKGIIATERPFDPTLKSGEIHYYDLLQLIQSTEAEVLVAEAGGQVVASGFVKILRGEPWQAFEHFGYLGFMYTQPAFRGQGINKQILEQLTAWAKSRNLTELRLDVYNENTGARTAYQKAGFKPELLRMRLGI
ncbi:MAG: GNAT family N-acetyltransferase [Chitinophagaceae bacterium]